MYNKLNSNLAYQVNRLDEMFAFIVVCTMQLFSDLFENSPYPLPTSILYGWGIGGHNNRNLKKCVNNICY